MAFQLVNFLDATLALSVVPGDSTITVLDADLAKVSVYETGKQLALTIVGDDSTQHEIVYVTGRTGTTLTVERGREGTSARAWDAGRRVVAGVTAATLMQQLGTVTAANVATPGEGLLTATAGDAVFRQISDMLAMSLAGERAQDMPVARIVPEQLVGDRITQMTDADGIKYAQVQTPGNGVAVVSNDIALPNLVGSHGVIFRLSVTNAVKLQRITLVFTGDSGAEKRLSLPASALTNIVAGNAERGYGFAGPELAVITKDGTFNKVRLEVADNSTGSITVSIVNIHVYLQSANSALLLKRVSNFGDLLAMVDLVDYGVGVIAMVDASLIPSTLSKMALAVAADAGVQFALAPNGASLRTQTETQVRKLFADGIAAFTAAAIRPVGFVYPEGYYGKLSTGNAYLHRLVAEYFPRGFAFAQVTGFAGNELPMVIPTYKVGAAELISAVVDSASRSVVLDLSALSAARLTTLKGAESASLRQHRAPLANRVQSILSKFQQDFQAFAQDVGYQPGDYITTDRVPGPKFIRMNGALYPKALYPDLAALYPPYPDGLVSTIGPGYIGNGTTGSARGQTVYGKGLYVTAGGSNSQTNNRAVYSSPDFKNFVQRTVSGAPCGMTFDGTRFVGFSMLGDTVNGLTLYVISSTDGITFTSRSLGSGSTAPLGMAAYFKGAYYTTRWIGSNNTNELMRLTDVANGSLVSAGIIDQPNNSQLKRLDYIYADDDVMMICRDVRQPSTGSFANTAFTSIVVTVNGTTFTSITSNASTGMGAVYSIAKAFGAHWASTDTGIWKSTDKGLNWTFVTTLSGSRILPLVFDGTVLYSPNRWMTYDGVTWTDFGVSYLFTTDSFQPPICAVGRDVVMAQRAADGTSVGLIMNLDTMSTQFKVPSGTAANQYIRAQR